MFNTGVAAVKIYVGEIIVLAVYLLIAGCKIIRVKKTGGEAGGPTDRIGSCKQPE
jgi:hypothetical protein